VMRFLPADLDEFRIRVVNVVAEPDQKFIAVNGRAVIHRQRVFDAVLLARRVDPTSDFVQWDLNVRINPDLSNSECLDKIQECHYAAVPSKLRAQDSLAPPASKQPSVHRLSGYVRVHRRFSGRVNTNAENPV